MIYIILFIYLFNPPILPFNLVHILSFFSIIYLVCVERKNIVELLKNSKFVVFIILMAFAIFYMLIIMLLSGQQCTPLLSYILILENIPIIIYIYCYCKKRKITFYQLIKKIIIVGTIQGLIALITYVNPNVHEILVNLLIKNGYGLVLEKLSAHRIFGFASNLTYSTPILQMFLTIIAIEIAITKKEKWMYLCIPILLFSGIINARTTIGILLVGVVCIIFFNINKKNYKAMIIITILICCAMGYVTSYTGNNSNIKWIKVGINEITTFSKGETTGYFDTLFNKFMLFPNGIDLIGGTGSNIFGKEGENSDVGFINDIWMGGILLCVLLYSANIYIILNVEIPNNYIKKFYVIFACLTAIIMNIKGVYAQGNNVLSTFMLIFGFSNNMYNKEELKDGKEFNNYNY